MCALIQNELDEYKARVDVGTLAIASYHSYLYAANLHTLTFFKNIYLHEVSGEMLEEFIKKLPFTRKRIGLILRPLRNIFDAAVRRGVLTLNPMNSISSRVFLTKCIDSDYEVNPFNSKEIELILQNCKYKSIKNFIQFGFWTGMRIGEIFALEWPDISFIEETISITKASTVKGIIKEPKTKAGIRILEMTPKAKEALKNQYELTGEHGGRIFLSPKNRPWIKPSAFREYWKKALTLGGVIYRNPYQMRHTFISYMLSIGNNPLVLYQMVGHENPKIMFDKYARFIKHGKAKKLLYTNPN